MKRAHVSEILDVNNLWRHIRDGYISMAESEDGRLTVYNYTNKAVYENRWDNETEICRGLVLENGTGYVLARPFRKFFNMTEEDKVERKGQKFIVTDKLDGSLIITFRYLEGIYVATRGSFVSEQAIAAKKFLRSATWYIPDGETWLFEWIGPNNRVVLKYAQPELILLSKIQTITGRDIDLIPPYFNYGSSYSKQIKKFDYVDLDELDMNRPNAEGYVLRYEDGTRYKLKQEDYLLQHRAIYNLSSTSLWEALSAGKSLEEIISPLPDEFQEWAKTEGQKLLDKAAEIKYAARAEYIKLMSWLGPEASRKDFAMQAKDSPNSTLLFAHLDKWHEKDIDVIIWKKIKPAYFTPKNKRVDEE